MPPQNTPGQSGSGQPGSPGQLNSGSPAPNMSAPQAPNPPGTGPAIRQSVDPNTVTIPQLMAAAAPGFDVSTCHECSIAANHPLLKGMEQDIHQAAMARAGNVGADLTPLVEAGLAKLRALAIALKTGSVMLDNLLALSGKPKPAFVQIIEDFDVALINVLPAENPGPGLGPGPAPAPPSPPPARSGVMPVAGQPSQGQPAVPSSTVAQSNPPASGSQPIA